MSITLPLAGLRVLDASRILAGPFCCQILGDLGADVVKVERPGSGDDTRQWGPPFLNSEIGKRKAESGNLQGPSAYYLSANRNKRSIALDLSKPEGRAVLEYLIRKADVLIENFLPESAAKLGLAPERLAELNPNLVSCSISGYGRTGPLANVPGYDLVIQATAGIMSITGEPDGMPMKVGVAITDIITGLYAAVSVLAGLHARGKGRPGMAFDLALADCTLASLVNVAQAALLTGERPQRLGNAHPHIVPYEAFATADGHLVLAVGNVTQWQRFCAAVGRADWAAEPRFATNPLRVEHRGELIPQIQQLLAMRSTAEWQTLLSAADVPHAPIQPLDEIFKSPQFAARGMVQSVTDSAGREFAIVGSPIYWQDAPDAPPHSPPALGEHTRDVLADWLNYNDAQVAALLQAGVCD